MKIKKLQKKSKSKSTQKSKVFDNDTLYNASSTIAPQPTDNGSENLEESGLNNYTLKNLKLDQRLTSETNTT